VRVLIALGGNALLHPDEPATAETQRENAARAARIVAGVAREHEVVLTHGNGPQIGLLARQAAAAIAEGGASTLQGHDALDALGAETEGLIGYLLARALRNAAPESEIVSLLTQVEVDPQDPGFTQPTKPIGPVWPVEEADSIPMRGNWIYVRDRGGLRRAVASPEPLRILELPTIERLVSAGVLVVCAGGGGIPVVRRPDGRLDGAEAVIDKDLTSALLATSLGCDRLLLLTDVEAVYSDWPEKTRPIRQGEPDSLRALRLDAGSMAPKVEAACRFVDATRGTAAIGRLEDGEAVLRGEAGTRISRERPA
jgi:carbamate kinase